MIDSFGDGWNGNILDISDASGSLGSFTVPAEQATLDNLQLVLLLSVLF